AEKNRILKIMRDADIYTLTLDPLIESYLDIFEVYMTMFIEWKEKGFPPTQRHTNKSNAFVFLSAQVSTCCANGCFELFVAPALLVVLL
ncbi:hypothetical protein ACUODJ_55350, partial [Escherichia sp. HC-CC]